MKSDARLPIFLFLLSATFSTTSGAASCTTSTLETMLSIPDMTVRHDTPIGAEIGTTVVTGPINTFNCTSGFTHQGFYVKGFGLASSQINGLNIYKLGGTDSGIGYAVYGEPIDTCKGFKPVTGTSDIGGVDVQRLCQALNGTFPTQPMQAVLKLVFYKIGTIEPGKMASQIVGGFALINNHTTWVTPESRVRSSAFTVSTLGCFVDKTDISVPLGEVGMKQLASAGTTAAEQAFSIPLSCDVGTKVKLTLSADSAGVYDNTKGLLNLANATSAETAQGVKVQILSNETPVTYDKALDIGTQTATGAFTIALKARYYRSAETLKSGTANSSVTYTITYE
ncbi:MULTISPECIES: fimbrial protein [unclassified Pseudomonas]|uniref:fimbrial protein n=1 Tax=unclassified Pseudomonas TaxID=196821 RepID=UPI00111C6F65|nr:MULTISPECIES: fimbrial protein [unclassified Pseudomonas]